MKRSYRFIAITLALTFAFILIGYPARTINIIGNPVPINGQTTFLGTLTYFGTAIASGVFTDIWLVVILLDMLPALAISIVIDFMLAKSGYKGRR